MLLTYWNTVAFHALYARANGWSPDGRRTAGCGATGPRPVAGLQPQPPGPRRHRRAGRLRHPARRAAAQRLRRRPVELVRPAVTATLLGGRRRPRCPRCTRRWTSSPGCWLLSSRSSANASGRTCACATDRSLPPSVHLAQWPSYDESLIDDVPGGRHRRSPARLVELGRAARAEAKVRTRQPLRRALVSSAARAMLSDDLAAEVAARAQYRLRRLVHLRRRPGRPRLPRATSAIWAGGSANRTPAVAAAIEAADASTARRGARRGRSNDRGGRRRCGAHCATT